MEEQTDRLHRYYPVGTRKEPWVELPTGTELASWSESDQVAYNQMRRQAAKHEFYIQAFDFLYANEIKGDYLEFGCHRVRTFRMALTEARRQNMEFMSFWAFDSFEGLPALAAPDEVAVSDYRKGALKTSTDDFRAIVEAHGIYTDRIHTVKGFYHESLTPDLRQRLLQEQVKAALICVDCDLYESAVPVFSFIEPFLQPGTIIYMDDFHVGYRGSPFAGIGKAFSELCERSKFRFAPYLPVGGFGFSFVTCA